MPLRLLHSLGAIPSYYLRYFYQHDVVVGEQRGQRTRAEEVMDIERELLEIYRDPAVDTKPELLTRRGGAFYSEAAVQLLASLSNDTGDVQVVDVRNNGALPELPDDAVVEVPCAINRAGATPAVSSGLAPSNQRARRCGRRLRAARRRGGRDRRPRDRVSGAARPPADLPDQAGRAVARRHPRGERGASPPVSNMTSTALLAVDGGNSKTDVALLDVRGSVLAAVRGPGSSPHYARPRGLIAGRRRADRSACDDAGIRRGSKQATDRSPNSGRGSWPAPIFPPRSAPCIARSTGWAAPPSNSVANDTFAILRAGADEGWGVAVVVGAGINCVGRSPDGRRARFAALGDITGDWGGGADIGMAALGAAVRAEDGRSGPTRLRRDVADHFQRRRATDVAIALHQDQFHEKRLRELAPIVVAAAEADDAAAIEILNRQADEVVSFVVAAIRRLRIARLRCSRRARRQHHDCAATAVRHPNRGRRATSRPDSALRRLLRPPDRRAPPSPPSILPAQIAPLWIAVRATLKDHRIREIRL